MRLNKNTHNSHLAPTLLFLLRKNGKFKENKFNFGTIIFRKSCADRLGANRYA